MFTLKNTNKSYKSIGLIAKSPVMTYQMHDVILTKSETRKPM